MKCNGGFSMLVKGSFKSDEPISWKWVRRSEVWWTIWIACWTRPWMGVSSIPGVKSHVGDILRQCILSWKDENTQFTCCKIKLMHPWPLVIWGIAIKINLKVDTDFFLQICWKLAEMGDFDVLRLWPPIVRRTIYTPIIAMGFSNELFGGSPMSYFIWNMPPLNSTTHWQIIGHSNMLKVLRNMENFV